MSNIITDLKQRFQNGSISLQLIYINIGIYLLLTLTTVFLRLFNIQGGMPIHWLEMPSDIMQLLMQPWSLVTYAFLHTDIFHLLFNMLWLYWFGQLFLFNYSSKHLRGLYILGAIAGGFLYLLAYNVFPYFQNMVNHSWLLGASASVLAIVLATAVSMPDYKLNLLLFGQVRLKYMALFVVLSDLLFITSGNAGGHIAHLGGALAGWWFAAGLRKGRDVTKWINAVIDWLGNGWKMKKTSQKPKMKVHNGGRAGDYEYNARKKEQNEEIDHILDKLKKSGYQSLTTEEKKRLFDASRR